MGIQVRNVSKKFGAFTALADVSLDVEDGELVALLGPSGSGKTTLLRVIGGLDAPDCGTVLFDGRDGRNVGADRRRVGFVFQHYALFRHMSVFENVAFGLRVRPRRARPAGHEIRQRVERLLDLVQLAAHGRRHPHELSGGQRQRVALARALAIEPRVLLLDEPFGALDARVRQELRRWLRHLHEELRVTSVFVTHDQEEALEVANRVAIMNQGRIEQVGGPADVYDHPATPFVYEFLGEVNIFRGRVEGRRAWLGRVAFDLPEGSSDATGSARVYVRPHELDVSVRSNGGQEFGARVDHVNAAGPIVKLELTSDWGEPLRVELSRERYQALHLEADGRVVVSIKGQPFVTTPPGGGVSTFLTRPQPLRHPNRPQPPAASANGPEWPRDARTACDDRVRSDGRCLR